MALTTAGLYTDYPGASSAAIPGEAVEADPYGALALLEATGQTVAPPVSQLAAAPGATIPAALPSVPSVLTDTFSVAGLQIPYWTIGAAAVAVWLYSRRR